MENRAEKEKKIDFGVAFLLEKEVSDKSIETVEKIKGLGFDLVFGIDEKHPPHISLLQGAVFENDLDKIKNDTKELEGLLDAGLEILMEGKLYFNRRNGNIFWLSQKEEKIQNIHDLLREKAASITGGKVMDQFEKVLKDPAVPEETKANIRKYGAVLAGPNFLPHITIGRIKMEGLSVEDVEEKLQSINLPEIRFKCYLKDMITSRIDGFGRVSI